MQIPSVHRRMLWWYPLVIEVTPQIHRVFFSLNLIVLLIGCVCNCTQMGTWWLHTFPTSSLVQTLTGSVLA